MRKRSSRPWRKKKKTNTKYTCSLSQNVPFCNQADINHSKPIPKRKIRTISLSRASSISKNKEKRRKGLQARKQEFLLCTSHHLKLQASKKKKIMPKISYGHILSQKKSMAHEISHEPDDSEKFRFSYYSTRTIEVHHIHEKISYGTNHTCLLMSPRAFLRRSQHEERPERIK